MNDPLEMLYEAITPDYFKKYKGIEIENGIKPFVYILWKNGIDTLESGADIPITDHDEIEDIKNDGVSHREYITTQQQYRERAFIVIWKKDLIKAKQFLPKNIEIENGTGGFNPLDYNPGLTTKDFKNMVYIQWTMYK